MKTAVTLALALASLASPSLAREVTIRGPAKEIIAHVVPAKEWCSSVVSVELRGPRRAFLTKPEDTQRLLIGTQVAISEDCPQTEVIRIRGVDKTKSLFLAYMDKSDRWSISVVEAEKELLAMLRLDAGKEDNVRKIALLETKTHMARVGFQGLTYEADPSDKEDVRQNWEFLAVKGSTFVILNRKDKFGTLSLLADTFANALLNECEKVETLTTDSLKSGIEVRGFDCIKAGVSTAYILQANEIGEVSRVFITSSSNKPELIEFNRLLADGGALY